MPLTLLIPLAAGLALVTADAVIERRVGAMGTSLHVEIGAADRAGALASSEVAIRAIETAEQRLSTWRESSELSRLNQLGLDESSQLSDELHAELEAAFRWSRQSDGAFDPSVGSLVEAWGLRVGGRVPAAEELALVRERCGVDAFSLSTPGQKSVARRVRAGVTLEAGGFGKGAGLDSAIAALRATATAHAFLDLGGQLAFFGETSGATRDFEIAHPLHRDQPVVRVRCAAGSLATSGNSERGVVVGGTSVGHLLDPRTGLPAEDFGSVTVWAPSALDADALSTALFVMGPAEGLAWVTREVPSAHALFLIVQGERLVARSTPGWIGIQPLVSDLESTSQ